MPASRWNLAVAVSAVIVAVIMLAIGIGWAASNASKNSTSSFGIPLREVDLKLSSGSATIIGTGASTIRVRRTDDYAFGHAARERRTLSNGTLRLESSCPRILIGSCSASYEIAVPETAKINVQTTAGNIRLSGFRGTAQLQSGSGRVDVDAYCGFDLSATSESGNVRVAAACAPQHLSLKTGSGDATAQVPPGRYRVTTTAGGTEHVAGIIQDENAPFTIDTHSASGNVTVDGGL
jgi:DUF4097 and DUF4098 domain-containing protein YvlB